MFDRIKEILMDQLNLDESEITEDSRIKEDLGADSLDVLQLLMSLEEETGIVIPDEKLAEFETVKDVVDYLENEE